MFKLLLLPAVLVTVQYAFALPTCYYRLTLVR